MGIICGCDNEVCTVGNEWKDVTDDFEFQEVAIPMSMAAVAGNRVLHFTATIVLTETASEEVTLISTAKWRSMVDSTFPIMVVHTDGTVTMIDGTYYPNGTIKADVTGVSTDDNMYINIVVPTE